jgi:hypothetical protein
MTVNGVVVLRSAAPASNTRLSPMTMSRAAARTSSCATSFAVSSGLTPAGSPIASAIVGCRLAVAFTLVSLA